jgi:hypothetical protein
MSESMSPIFFPISLFLSSSSRPSALHALASDGRSSWSSRAPAATAVELHLARPASCSPRAGQQAGGARGAHVRRPQPRQISISRTLDPALRAVVSGCRGEAEAAVG